MEKHVESKYFFTKFGHFYFIFLLYMSTYTNSCASLTSTVECFLLFLMNFHGMIITRPASAQDDPERKKDTL